MNFIGNQPSEPAPALSRGLSILSELSAHAPLSLEEITSRLGLPKASVFRLLATLLNLGVIRRRSDKRYEPLWVLRPLQDHAAALQQRLFDGMPALAKQLEATAEWYEPGAEGMVLMKQEVPEGEIRVQARPGFLRSWREELDSVHTLGRAFHLRAPQAPDRLPAYVANGRMGSISTPEARQRIALAQGSRRAQDPFFNRNSVRRSAVAVLAGETFLGVLAVAQVFSFEEPEEPDLLWGKLENFLKTFV